MDIVTTWQATPPRSGAILFLACTLVACGSLLPQSRNETKTPWSSYASGQLMFAKITPGKTTLAELKAIGIDADQTPNVALLSQADLWHKLVAAPNFDVGHVAPELQPCFHEANSCTAYEIAQNYTERKRIGNFWTDFLNFRRQTDVSGWQFDAIVVVKGKIVIYKLWSGKPNIHQLEDSKNPLGPLQGAGTAL